MPATETNPIDCRGFPRQGTKVFLPRAVFHEHSGDQKTWLIVDESEAHDTQHKCWYWMKAPSTEYPPEKKIFLPNWCLYCHWKQPFNNKKELLWQQVSGSQARLLKCQRKITSLLIPFSHSMFMKENTTMIQILRKRNFVTATRTICAFLKV